MAVYRQRKGRDTWHFCANCSRWPKDGEYKERPTKPSHAELCDECKSKRDRGECREA